MASTEAGSAEHSESGEAAHERAAGLRHQKASELLGEVFDESRELARLEIAIAREELKEDVKKVERGGGAMSAAAGLGLVALTLALVALATAFPKFWVGAVVLAAAVLGLAGALALFGWKAVPKEPMAETRRRVEADVTKLKDRALP